MLQMLSWIGRRRALSVPSHSAVLALPSTQACERLVAATLSAMQVQVQVRVNALERVPSSQANLSRRWIRKMPQVNAFLRWDNGSQR